MTRRVDEVLGFPPSGRRDGVRISYGVQDGAHDTYVVFVPLAPDLDFPAALNQAISQAGAHLRRGIAEGTYSTGAS